ncbi:unnamed protein product [Choristocarpus tenellus]
MLIVIPRTALRLEERARGPPGPTAMLRSTPISGTRLQADSPKIRAGCSAAASPSSCNPMWGCGDGVITEGDVIATATLPVVKVSPAAATPSAVTAGSSATRGAGLAKGVACGASVTVASAGVADVAAQQQVPGEVTGGHHFAKVDPPSVRPESSTSSRVSVAHFQHMRMKDGDGGMLVHGVGDKSSPSSRMSSSLVEEETRGRVGMGGVGVVFEAGVPFSSLDRGQREELAGGGSEERQDLSSHSPLVSPTVALKAPLSHSGSCGKEEGVCSSAVSEDVTMGGDSGRDRQRRHRMHFAPVMSMKRRAKAAVSALSLSRRKSGGDVGGPGSVGGGGSGGGGSIGKGVDKPDVAGAVLTWGGRRHHVPGVAHRPGKGDNNSFTSSASDSRSSSQSGVGFSSNGAKARIVDSITSGSSKGMGSARSSSSKQSPLSKLITPSLPSMVHSHHVTGGKTTSLPALSAPDNASVVDNRSSACSDRVDGTTTTGSNQLGKIKAVLEAIPDPAPKESRLDSPVALCHSPTSTFSVSSATSLPVRLSASTQETLPPPHRRIPREGSGAYMSEGRRKTVISSRSEELPPASPSLVKSRSLRLVGTPGHEVITISSGSVFGNRYLRGLKRGGGIRGRGGPEKNRDRGEVPRQLVRVQEVERIALLGSRFFGDNHQPQVVGAIDPVRVLGRSPGLDRKMLTGQTQGQIPVVRVVDQRSKLKDKSKKTGQEPLGEGQGLAGQSWEQEQGWGGRRHNHVPVEQGQGAGQRGGRNKRGEEVEKSKGQAHRGEADIWGGREKSQPLALCPTSLDIESDSLFEGKVGVIRRVRASLLPPTPPSAGEEGEVIDGPGEGRQERGGVEKGNEILPSVVAKSPLRSGGSNKKSFSSNRSPSSETIPGTPFSAATVGQGQGQGVGQDLGQVVGDELLSGGLKLSDMKMQPIGRGMQTPPMTTVPIISPVGVTIPSTPAIGGNLKTFLTPSSSVALDTDTDETEVSAHVTTDAPYVQSIASETVVGGLSSDSERRQGSGFQLLSLQTPRGNRREVLAPPSTPRPPRPLPALTAVMSTPPRGFVDGRMVGVAANTPSDRMCRPRSADLLKGKGRGKRKRARRNMSKGRKSLSGGCSVLVGREEGRPAKELIPEAGVGEGAMFGEDFLPGGEEMWGGKTPIGSAEQVTAGARMLEEGALVDVAEKDRGEGEEEGAPVMRGFLGEDSTERGADMAVEVGKGDELIVAHKQKEGCWGPEEGSMSGQANEGPHFLSLVPAAPPAFSRLWTSKLSNV